MQKKHTVLWFIILLLLAVTILSSCKEDNMNSIKSSLNFSEFKLKNIDDISLTIYYVSPLILTRAPLSVDDLVHRYEENKVFINSSGLKEHIDLLNQIINTTLMPVENNSFLDARLYYVLESDKDGKIFDVAMCASDGKSIFVNGNKVEMNDIFCKIVIPFLPEDIAKYYRSEQE